MTGHPLPRTASHYSVDVDCKLLEFNLTISGSTGTSHCKLCVNNSHNKPSADSWNQNHLSSEGSFNSNKGATPLVAAALWTTSR